MKTSYSIASRTARVQEVRQPGSVWQFDPIGVFPVALVFFGKNFFKPLCLRLGNRLVRRRGMVMYEELFAATVTS
jgi:hypothetical protein